MENTKYSKRSHITVSIPRDLVERIKELINQKELKGYRNHSEFITESIRKRLQEYEKNNFEEKELKKLIEEFKKFKKNKNNF